MIKNCATKSKLPANRHTEWTERFAIINLITQTSLIRSKAPIVKSNKDTMIVAFAKSLHALGSNIDVYVSDAYKPIQNESLVIPIKYLKTYLKFLFWPSRIPFTPDLIKQLKNNYSVVICSEIFQFSTILAIISKILSQKKPKIVVWQEMARHQKFAGYLLSKFYHTVIVKCFIDRHIDIYIPRSELAKNFLLAQNISPKKISTVIPHGIDSSKFFYDPSVRKKKYIFSPSRLVKYKGIDVLLKAFAIVHGVVSEIQLIIQGDGPLHKEYKKLASELNISHSVIFKIERINHNLMRKLYQNALLTVIASRADNIIFSDMESISCGTPVVISNGADSHVNFLDNKGGAVFNNEDHQDLAKKILYFVANKNTKTAKNKIVLEKSKFFQNKVLTEKFYKIIKGIKT